MNYISEKAAGPAARRRRRRHRKQLKHIRVHHTKRALREQVAANVEGCFDICCDRGFHLDPDVNIGSDVDPSRNRFSALDSDWSSTASQSITPMRSQFTLNETNPCDSNAHSAPLALYLPSAPITPPSLSLPIVKVPGSVSNNEPKVVLPGLESLHITTNDASTTPCKIFLLPQIQSPFLYHNDSREVLGVDERSPSPPKSFATTCGQELPNPNFKSYKVDAKSLNGSSRQHSADDDASQVMPQHETLFVGAALPDMSKAVPARASTLTCLDPYFYKHTRSYLERTNKAGERSDLGSVAKASTSGGTTSKIDGSKPPILTTTITFPRWLRKMTYVFPRPCPQGLPLKSPLTVPLGASHEPGVGLDKLHLWEPITSTQVQPQNSMHGFIFPTLEPAAGCKASVRSQSRDATDGFVRRMTNLLDSSHRIRLWKTELRPQGTFTKSTNDAEAFDTRSAMAAFERTMNKASTVQANTRILTGLWTPPEKLQASDSRRDSLVSLPRLTSQCSPCRRHTSPIRDAAVQSAMKPRALSEGVKTVDLEACPTSVYNALIPTKLYEQQYIGWPQRRKGEDIAYKDKAWLSLGAYIARLQKEEAGQPTTPVPVKVHNHQSLPTVGEDSAPQNRTWFEKVAHVGRLQKEQMDVKAKSEGDIKLNTGAEKTVEHVAGDLGMEMKHHPDCQYAEAWLQVLAGESDVLRVGSNHGLCNLVKEKTKPENSKAAEREYSANGAVVGDDVPLSFFDELVKTPDSEVGWSEIDTESDSEGDWDWSDDDLGA